VKREDNIWDNTKENFLETQEKTHSWLGNEQIKKKHADRSYTRDPYLGHAAGDYEPINENSRFHVSEDPKRTVDKSSKEKKFTENSLEEQHRAEIPGDIRSIFGAEVHDQQ
jgi:hypothetical protein